MVGTDTDHYVIGRCRTRRDRFFLKTGHDDAPRFEVWKFVTNRADRVTAETANPHFGRTRATV
jgi:hypothetical protein